MNKEYNNEIDLLNTGVRINLDIGTQLSIEIEEVLMPLKSIFIGMDSNRYLIISCPTPFAPIKHKLYTGNHIILKYFHKGTVYAFQSKVIDITTKPIKLLFLEYPKIVQRQDLRKQKRMSCYIPVKIKFNKEEANGAILDINEGGCRSHIKKMECKDIQSVQVEDQITLLFPFPGIEGELAVSGSIKNLSCDSEGMNLGILFSKNSAEVQDRIAQYILSVYDFI